jgi:dihydroorotate dehydrogenase (NAD+) catalytic subunit
MWPRYDEHRTYEWNYEHAPEPVPAEVPSVPGEWDYCGLPVASPLGIAAGPLLNGRWILYYASLGFDVLTYKTVRSSARGCYDLPNLQPVRANRVTGGDPPLSASGSMAGSWAVSFGMPSRSPDVWRADVTATRRALPRGKVLSVSVVATPQPEWTPDAVADDYARCARWAVDSGADCVEANFSCPNVASCDGQLYQRPDLAGIVAARLREAVGPAPLLIKIGHVAEELLATNLIAALEPHAQALVMVNCIAATVVGADGRPLFDGERRGIAGAAIRDACVDQVRLFARIIGERRSTLRLVGVGGISTAEHVGDFLRAGADAVQLATSAMRDSGVGIAMRKQANEWSCEL